MEYKIILKRKMVKKLEKLPFSIQEKFKLLARDLINSGPVQKDWPNYSKLGKDKFHCHLSYSYLACWEHKKETIIIEVYYVGSREKAPY